MKSSRSSPTVQRSLARLVLSELQKYGDLETQNSDQAGSGEHSYTTLNPSSVSGYSHSSKIAGVHLWVMPSACLLPVIGTVQFTFGQDCETSGKSANMINGRHKV